MALTMDSWPTIVLSMIFLIACSAFFSGSEIAFASANRLRLKKAAEEGGFRARVTDYIAENYDNALCTVLIGNNIVNMAASSVATLAAIAVVGEATGPAWATFFSTILILIFGEITPKIVAKQHCDGFAGAVALPLRLLMVLLSPLVAVVLWLVDKISVLWGGEPKPAAVTEDELVTLIETVEDEGVIDEERSDLLQSAIEFSEIEAQEITTHRVDMLAIDIEEPLDEVERIVNHSPFSRIPVYEGSIDNIIGVLYLNHYFKALLDDPDADLRKLLMEPCYVYKTTKLPAVLETLKRAKQHLAIVTDEYGGCLGLITMEDVLEQIVGDIWDETDEIENEVVERASGEYELDGDMAIDDFTELVGLDDEAFETESATVGGWTLEMFGTYPQEGQSFKYENLTVTVLKMDGLRVEKVLVQVHPERKDEED